MYLSRVAQLTYRPNADKAFEVFVDSNWSPSFSISGAQFYFMDCMFYWFSKTQRSVSLSTAEAEMFGLCLATKEAIFLRDILFDLGVLPVGPTPILLDSKSAVDLSLDPIAFKKTKHIMRACWFVLDSRARSVITVSHISGTEMLADILTKPVSRANFLTLFYAICLKMDSKFNKPSASA